MIIRHIMIIVFCCCYAIGCNSQDIWLDTVQTLSGFFEQKTSHTNSHVWRGRFFLKPPYHMRWINDEPFRQEIVCDGDFLWNYDLSLASVVRYPLEHYKYTPIPLLFSAQAREEYFETKCVYSSRRETHWQFTPKSPNNDYRYILLVIENKVLKRLYFYDHSGNRVEIVFSDIILNKPILSRNFVFTIPEGVDFIDAAKVE